MKKINFYELSHSVDEDVIGPVEHQIDDFIDSKNNSVKRTSKYQEFYYDYLPADLDLMKFRGDKDANPTDLLNSLWLSTSGFFISSDFVQVLEKFTISNHKYRDVYIKYLSEKKNYCYLNLIMSSIIDFSKSSFIIEDFITDECIGKIELKSVKDFRDNINKLSKKENSDHTINPDRLVLKQVPDLFKEELTGTILISEKLKSALKKAKLTGYTTELSEMKFYH
jgi:hypothetical protein